MHRMSISPLIRSCCVLGMAWACLPAADTISGGLVTVTVDQGRYAFQAQGQAAPFARGALRSPGVVRTGVVDDAAFGQGQAITITAADGAGEIFTVFPRLPFVLHHATLVNGGAAELVLNKVPLLDAVLELGQPVDALVTLGTGGLKPLAKAAGSYAWAAVADPASRAGVVGGWLTHERGSGVVFPKVDAGKAALEARLEYGRLPIAPGKTVATETFIIGWFADARLGLEAWADAVARRLAIKLPPMPTVYCTWYDDVHGRAGNAASIAEMSAFTAKELKPYGFTCVQIDDGYQLGDAKKNGPRKVFTGVDPKGPFPAGMKPTADGIRRDGLTAGLWLMPFSGTWNDPFYEPHQDWFVKKPDGKPFDTAWGGTALDMSQPGAREFIRGIIRQAVHDWGYHYLKLDGLSTGAGVKPQYVNDTWKEDNLGDGIFHDPSKSHVEVFRDGLRLVREAAGPSTFILGCCASQNMRSYAGAFGLVDAMRTGPDNSGNWKAWLGASPRFGVRNHHLHGRIWWNDPDPIYVRAKIPLESARCIASWNAIAGHMISLSDWLPKLPAERLDIIRRCIPAHGVTSRPVDLFDEAVPRIWLVTDDRADRQRRDVLGLSNWKDAAETMTIPVARLGLPSAASYIAYDFWNRTLVKPFTDTLVIEVPGAGCRVLAVRPLLPRPFLLSTSRHVSQGILEVREERWDDAARTLSGVSAVVGGDAYELRIVAQDATVSGVALSAEDQAAGATCESATADGLVTVRIAVPANREVRWTVRFAAR